MGRRVFTRTIFLVGSFGIPVYTFVFPTSYLTRNNCDGFFYVFMCFYNILMALDGRSMFLDYYFVPF